MNSYQDLYNFRTLRVYLYYRLVLSALLYIMLETNITGNSFGNDKPDLFRWASLIYTFAAIGSLSLLLDKNAFRSINKICFLLFSDLGVLVVLIHASGGISSSLGYLLVITSAIASMFLPKKMAFGFAALTSILIIAETIYASQQERSANYIFRAGLLGFLLFVTTLTFQYLTEKIQSSTREAVEKGEYAKQVVQLAQHIVTRMRTGIAVIDESDRIELINDSARKLLDLPRDRSFLGANISSLSNLDQLLNIWRQNPVAGMAQVHQISPEHEVRINFASLETKSKRSTILYLEDHRVLMQQAHQLKLASLGRLTASIAHEIRNPLGAISHAAQLLGESEKLDKTDARFAEIILQHTGRVNQIIENTMALSKRKDPKAEIIDLKEWIPLFISEYTLDKSCQVNYSANTGPARVKVDPSHLRQILTNLFDNGLRYSMETTQIASIDVRSGLIQNDDTTYVEVIDHGPGVPEDQIQEIFEPFFTTGEQGTGLGLYISRELCEINQATLNYTRVEDNKSCFKINFPHYQRMI